MAAHREFVTEAASACISVEWHENKNKFDQAGLHSNDGCSTKGGGHTLVHTAYSCQVFMYQHSIYESRR